MFRPALVASALALAVGACTTSSGGGGCGGINFAAPYAVQADTRIGQRWVNKTIEVGVRSCGHSRPPERPQ